MSDLWSQIPRHVGQSVRIRTRPGSVIFWALSADGRRQLRLLEPSGTEVSRTPLLPLTGLKVFNECVEENTHLVVQLEDPNLLDIFEALCSDLEEQAFEAEHPKNVVINRLQHWTDLLQRRRSGLDALAQQGMFAELVFLKTLLGLGRSEADAVADWKGPNHIHDFTIGEKAVEVKSFVASAGSGEIHVQNEDQINPTAQMQLHLYVVSVQKDCPNGKNLLEMYQDLESMIHDQGTRDLLKRKILLYGLDLERESSSLIQFSVEDEYLFEVREDFPSLHRNRIPDAVRTVKYRLSLHHIESYRRPISEVVQS